MTAYYDKSQYGFTLIEIVLIILIIGIIGTIAIRSFKPSLEQAKESATLEEMDILAMAIAGDTRFVKDGIRTDFGYVGDVGSLPPNLDALYQNPGGYSTWDGPYIEDGYDTDSWGDSYSYAGDVTITSPGNGVTITKKIADATSDLTSNTIFGTIHDGLGYVPGDDSADVAVTVFYPNGTGSMTSATQIPDRSGGFSFTNTIPIGNHLVKAINTVASETTETYISVIPASKSYCELRFDGGYWYSEYAGGSGDIIIEILCSNDSDDAEEDDGGGISLNNDKIELGQMKYVGLRFQNVGLPQGATITEAHIDFVAADNNSENTDITIWGEDTDDAAQINGSDDNISDRTQTSGSVAWNNIENWSMNQTYPTPYIAAIIQEIVGRAGWSSGNDLIIMLESTDLNGKRLFVAHDDDFSKSGLLHVEYN